MHKIFGTSSTDIYLTQKDAQISYGKSRFDIVLNKKRTMLRK